MEYKLPNDPAILLSYVNAQLRDHYESFEEMCLVKALNCNEIIEKLSTIDYRYDELHNQFK
ncbi:MAG: DUF4250 domain-containing protein [Lachnospiraceae bacterium]